MKLLRLFSRTDLSSNQGRKKENKKVRKSAQASEQPSKIETVSENLIEKARKTRKSRNDRNKAGYTAFAAPKHLHRRRYGRTDGQTHKARCSVAPKKRAREKERKRKT